jgi:hypothetical protein
MIAVWSPRVQVPVDAIVGDVGGAVLEPLDRDLARLEAGVLDLRERRHPVDALAVLAPEGVRIGNRRLVHVMILGIVDVSTLTPGRLHLNDLAFHGFPSLLGARSYRGLCRAARTSKVT